MPENHQFMKTNSRRTFLAVAGATISALLVPRFFHAQSSKAIPPKGDPLAADLVKQFVIFGHGNLEGTQQMLQEHPTLLNACWDWGNGDFETALGGASHVGSRECAEWLIAQGARMDIFAATMLGKLDIVKNMIAAYPVNAKCVGPHGISLMKHALKGGEAALPVVEYLKSLGVVE